MSQVGRGHCRLSALWLIQWGYSSLPAVSIVPDQDQGKGQGDAAYGAKVRTLTRPRGDSTHTNSFLTPHLLLVWVARFRLSHSFVSKRHRAP